MTNTEPIDRVVESEIEDLCSRLSTIRRRLIDVHDEIETIQAHESKDGCSLLLGKDYGALYPTEQVVVDIKEKFLHALLAEKATLHDQYRVLTGLRKPISRYRVMDGVAHGNKAWLVQDTDRKIDFATIAVCGSELDAYEIMNALNHDR